MTRTVGYHWYLRQVMAARGMFATTEMGPLLAERGVVLSREQVYRLVVGTPERLNLRTLAALCDILAVTPHRSPRGHRGLPAGRQSGGDTGGGGTGGGA